MLELFIILDTVKNIPVVIDIIYDFLVEKYSLFLKYYYMMLSLLSKNLLEPNNTHILTMYVYMIVITYISFVLFRFKNHNLKFNYYVYTQLVKFEEELKNNSNTQLVNLVKEIKDNRKHILNSNKYIVNTHSNITKHFKLVYKKFRGINLKLNNNYTNVRRYNLRSLNK